MRLESLTTESLFEDLKFEIQKRDGSRKFNFQSESKLKIE